MSLSNDIPRLYGKLQKCHNKIMATIDGRLCVDTIKDYVEYKQLVRRIVDAQNKDAKIIYESK